MSILTRNILFHQDSGNDDSDHSHSHSRQASHPHIHGEPNERNLLITVVLNFVITITEIIGGLLSNSLALLSDALHNLSDTIAVFIAYIAMKIGKWSSNEKKTYGYKRIEILTALLNAVVLIVICIYLFWEAYERFIDPQPIKGLLMLVVATIGLLANLISVLLLNKDKNKNINIKAAYLHLMGDTLSSVAVIIGGLFIYFYEFYWLDPVITVLIGLYIIKETLHIVKDTINILMQSTPANLDIDKIKHNIEKLDLVDNVHHVHAWNLDDSHIHFECHIDVANDLKVSETDSLRSQIEVMLVENYDITHTTIQIEFNCCSEKTLIHKSENDIK